MSLERVVRDAVGGVVTTKCTLPVEEEVTVGKEESKGGPHYEICYAHTLGSVTFD